MPQHSNHRSPRRRRQKDHEKILEIIVENFPKMGKEIITQVQETQRVPNRINPRQNMPRNILIKLTDQTQITNIKSSKGKTTNNSQTDPHKGNSWSFNRNSSDRREWQDILKVMKEEKPTTQISVPSKDLIQIWRRNQKLYRQQKLREVSTMKPALQQMLKDLL